MKMANKIEVNGKEVELKINKVSASKNIQTYKSDIFRWLSRIGIEKDYVGIEHSHYGYEKPFAEIRWMVNGKEHYYKCDSQENATGCVAAIEQLVHYEVIFIERGIKTFGQVMNQFRLGYDPDSPRVKTPREIIGVPETMNDLDYIKYRFRQKAKEFHSDKGGDNKVMQELNTAMESIKKELSD